MSPVGEPVTGAVPQDRVGTDAERLEQARGVVRGERPAEGSGNVVYAAYVAVLASLPHGVPAARAFLLFVDPTWLSRHLTGVQGVLVVGGAVLALVLLAHRLGSLRGPVVPDLPYL